MADQNTPSSAIPIRTLSVGPDGVPLTGGGSAVTIADNGNAVEGALADAAIITNSAGSISGKLRGIVALLSGVLTASSKIALTASSPTFVSVGVASGAAVAANANRKGLTLINTSAVNISFGIGVAAVLNNGITLVPNGVWEMDEYTFSTGAINAIAAGAASNLCVQEFTT